MCVLPILHTAATDYILSSLAELALDLHSVAIVPICASAAETK